jgi:hypothetical protein
VDVLATTTVNGTPSAAVGPVAALQAPATQIVVTTPASGAVSGRAFSTQPVIEIRNALGGVVTNSTATVTASVSAGATVVGTTTATAAAGIARFANFGISGTAATTYTITYSITVPTSISTTETVTPTASGAALNLAVGRPIAGASSGVAATTQPIVNLTDANGGIITTDSTSVVTVTITGPGTPSVSGITTATTVSGVATFSGLIITGTAGATYTLRYSLSTGEFTTESVTLSGGVTPLGAPGVAPSGVTVTGGTASATITWNAVAGATRYTAQVFSTPTSSRNVGQCSVRGNGGAATFSCTVTNLTRNFTFYVDIVARNSAGAISSQTRLPVTIL